MADAIESLGRLLGTALTIYFLVTVVRGTFRGSATGYSGSGGGSDPGGPRTRSVLSLRGSEKVVITFSAGCLARQGVRLTVSADHPDRIRRERLRHPSGPGPEIDFIRVSRTELSAVDSLIDDLRTSTGSFVSSTAAPELLVDWFSDGELLATEAFPGGHIELALASMVRDARSGDPERMDTLKLFVKLFPLGGDGTR